MTPTQFQAGAEAWIAVIGFVLAALTAALIKYGGPLVATVVKLQAQYEEIKARQDRHGSEISKIKDNSLPPGMSATPPAVTVNNTDSGDVNSAATPAAVVNPTVPNGTLTTPAEIAETTPNADETTQGDTTPPPDLDFKDAAQ